MSPPTWRIDDAAVLAHRAVLALGEEPREAKQEEQERQRCEEHAARDWEKGHEESEAQRCAYSEHQDLLGSEFGISVTSTGSQSSSL
jgi:tRNA(Met) C34 N-acetyltransferase TmcA